MPVVCFGDVELDLDALELRRAGRAVALQRRTLDLLRYLVTHAERVVEKRELFEAVWSGSVVSEAALTQAIKQARKAVGDDGATQSTIQTVRGRGYRFVAPIRLIETPTRAVIAEPFVGREALLADALVDFEAARAGSGRALLLSGEPGIGKSRAASEIAARAAEAGALVLSGRCLGEGGAPAYWPFTQALRGSELPLATMATLASDAGVIARAIPELAGPFADAPAPRPGFDPGTEGGRFLLFDALTRLIQEMSRERPLLLWLDDLHEADLPSLHLVDFVLRELTGSRALFVLTTREAELRDDAQRAPVMARIGRARGVRIARLKGLGARDIARFVELRTGRPVSSDSARVLEQKSGGNPFFLTQLVASGASWSPDDDLPASARDAIARHLEALPEDCREILAAAAVIGRQFRLAVLARMTGGQDERLPELLEPAVAARVVLPCSDTGSEFQFCHGLIPEVLVDQLNPDRRIGLHAKAARAIEAVHADVDAHLAELAAHYAKAAPGGDAGRAVEFGMRAGARAVQALAFEEAVAHYRRALEVSGLAELDGPRLLELLLALGEAQVGCASYGDARRALRRAGDLARSLGDAEALARAALGCAAEGETLEANHERITTLEEALEAVGPEPSSIRIKLLARLAEALYFSATRGRAQEVSLEALRMARELRQPADLVYALRRRHFTVFDAEHLDERLSLVHELLDASEELGDPIERLAARGSLIDDLIEAGDAPRLFSEVEAYRHQADALRQPHHQWWGVTHRAMVEHLRGNFAAAEAAMEQAYAFGLETSSALAPLWYLCQLWALRRDQGREIELEEPITETAGRFPHSPWRFGVASIHLTRGRPDEARILVESSVRNDFAAVRRDINWLVSLMVLSDLAFELEDEVSAEKLYRVLVPLSRQHVVVGQAVAYVGSVARCLGRLATLLQRFDTAARHLEMALERERAFGSRPNLAKVHSHYAELLLRLGDTEERIDAAGHLEQARAHAEATGMAGLLEQIRRQEEAFRSVARITPLSRRHRPR